MSESQPTLPVDLERLHDITNGETVIIQQLADDYFLQATDIIRELDHALQQQSVDSIKMLTHRLRGSSATFGITAVRNSAENIEHAMQTPDFGSAKRHLSDTHRNLEDARMFIKTYFV